MTANDDVTHKRCHDTAIHAARFDSDCSNSAAAEAGRDELVKRLVASEQLVDADATK